MDKGFVGEDFREAHLLMVHHTGIELLLQIFLCIILFFFVLLVLL